MDAGERVVRYVYLAAQLSMVALCSRVQSRVMRIVVEEHGAFIRVTTSGMVRSVRGL